MKHFLKFKLLLEKVAKPIFCAKILLLYTNISANSETIQF